MSYYNVSQQTTEGHLGQVTRLADRTQIVVQNVGISQGTFELQIFFLSLDLINIIKTTSSGVFTLNAGQLTTQVIIDPPLVNGTYTERILLNNLTFLSPRTDDSKELNITITSPSPTPTPQPIPQWVPVAAIVGVIALFIYATTRKKRRRK